MNPSAWRREILDRNPEGNHMPNVVEISTPADSEAAHAEAVAAVEAAQAAFDKLVEERRDKRAKLSREAFNEYNSDTHDQQLKATQDLADAQAQLRVIEARSVTVVEVKAAGESEKAGG